MIKKKIITLLFAAMSLMAFTQNGTINGVLTEAQDGKQVPMPFANVFLEGTTLGATSDFDGNFSFTAPEGSYVLTCSFMGYETFRKEIVLTAGGQITVNIEMKPEGIALEGVKVEAKMNRETEMALILEQKDANIAIEGIGAKELSAKGVSDAAAAVTKVTGISKQEDAGTLNIRGLGDRYNTTTINGLPIPSNKPSAKNIDLALFTTDVISHINIEKTYNAPLYGDFGGANINIISKSLTGNDFFEISVKSGKNSSVMGLDNFTLQDGPTKNGFYTEHRPDPQLLDDVSKYAFQNNWNPVVSNKILPNIGFRVAGGKSFEFGENKLSTFLTASFDNQKRYAERLEKLVGATGFTIKDMLGEEYGYFTQSTAMANLNFEMKNSEFYWNTILLNSTEQKYTSITGKINGEIEQGYKDRSIYQQNLIIVNQLLGNHQIYSFDVDWAIGLNNIINRVPDRRTVQFQSYDPETNVGEFETGASQETNRYFQGFDERELAGKLAVSKKFFEKTDSYFLKTTLGYSLKTKLRDFNRIQYTHRVNDDGNYYSVNNVDAFFNNSNYTDGLFYVSYVKPRTENKEEQDGELYNGNVNVNSVFALGEINLTKNWLILLGARYEYVKQGITVTGTEILGAIPGTETQIYQFEKNSFLPSFTSKYAITSKQNIRVAASKTYTLPQLQEMPLMTFDDNISDKIIGNPWLYPSDVYNLDFKWEFFPSGGDLYSVSVFGKKIDNPMNKTGFGGFDGQYVVANTGDWAKVYGIELDVKKSVFKIGSKKLVATANLSLLKSKTVLDGKKMAEETDNYFTARFNSAKSELQGAAPLLANASLVYKQKWNDNKNSVSGSVVYNYTDERLFAFGVDNSGNEYIQAINTLDIILKTEFNKIGVDFSAKNILNAEYVRVVKNRVRENVDHEVRRYKKGVNYSVSFKYNF